MRLDRSCRLRGIGTARTGRARTSHRTGHLDWADIDLRRTIAATSPFWWSGRGRRLRPRAALRGCGTSPPRRGASTIPLRRPAAGSRRARRWRTRDRSRWPEGGRRAARGRSSSPARPEPESLAAPLEGAAKGAEAAMRAQVPDLLAHADGDVERPLAELAPRPMGNLPPARLALAPRALPLPAPERQRELLLSFVHAASVPRESDTPSRRQPAAQSSMSSASAAVCVQGDRCPLIRVPANAGAVPCPGSRADLIERTSQGAIRRSVWSGLEFRTVSPKLRRGRWSGRANARGGASAVLQLRDRRRNRRSRRRSPAWSRSAGSRASSGRST